MVARPVPARPGSYALSNPVRYPHGPGYRPYPVRYPYHGYGRWGYPSIFWLNGWTGYYPGFWYGGLGWYDDSYSYSYPYAYPQTYPVYPDSTAPDADVYAQQQDEIDRLQQQVSRLSDQQATLSTRPTEPQTQSKPTIHGQTVLVYKDRHTEEIEDYAIVGKTLWIFNEERARKVPLSQLDLSATIKANEDRGIDFHVPQ